MTKKVVIAGSTGLVGKALIELMQKDESFSSIDALVRFKSIETYSKLHEHLTNFNAINQLPLGDILVICLGSTRKKAGSKEAFRKVDYGYVTRLARLAESQNFEQIIVVSSYGADAHSKNFYLRVKGEMEDVIQTINIPSKTIIRPSLLLGKRNEFRLGEKIGTVVLKLAMPLLKGKLLKYKPVEDFQVASVMVKIIKEASKEMRIIEPDWIHKNA